eukprot:TRINITY_DN60767_c0_g1_i1.p1 TRINITY_DN60767_c0_g1~~TRINITY_DN60767_c0_g1_i1.p1  ORF type:complete len:348 (-),score=62.14 TRINITY_DN60767_c0_g1_i1:27-1070(-)
MFGGENGPRWGLAGLGTISADFAVSLKSNGSNIAAVAARDQARAAAFAEKVGAKRAYGSYDELFADAGIDVVYIGTVHTTHFPLTKLALEAGKHVLCEKPMTLNEGQTQELVTLAQSKGLFLMEGFWTRFFPAIRKVRELIESGIVGAPKYLQAEFGFLATDDKTNRIWDPAQAGGAMLDIGCYNVAASTMVFGKRAPEQISAMGRKTEEGVDSEGMLSLMWAERGSANLMFTITADTPEDAVVICDQGFVRIHGPHHCPTRVTCARKGARGSFMEETFEFELPKLPEGLSVNLPNSEGFLYEVQAVEDCLKAGKTECEEFPLEESLVVVRIMDAYRKQVGVTYPGE